MLETLHCADFEPLVGQEFYLTLAGYAPIALTLERATELGQPRAPGLRRPFSLLFLGPESGQYLRQGTYRLAHDQLDELELFIVPLGPRGGRMQYEAIFT